MQVNQNFMLTGKIVGVIMQMITGNLSKEAAASFGCIATERKNFVGKTSEK